MSSGMIFLVIATLTAVCEVAFIYFKYHEVNNYLNEQCKGLTDKKAIAEFKRNHWFKGIKLTFLIIFLLTIPMILMLGFIWLL